LRAVSTQAPAERAQRLPAARDPQPAQHADRHRREQRRERAQRRPIHDRDEQDVLREHARADQPEQAQRRRRPARNARRPP
jgi:hypothetical protein